MPGFEGRTRKGDGLRRRWEKEWGSGCRFESCSIHSTWGNENFMREHISSLAFTPFAYSSFLFPSFVLSFFLFFLPSFLLHTSLSLTFYEKNRSTRCILWVTVTDGEEKRGYVSNFLSNFCSSVDIKTACRCTLARKDWTYRRMCICTCVYLSEDTHIVFTITAECRIRGRSLHFIGFDLRKFIR